MSVLVFVETNSGSELAFESRFGKDMKKMQKAHQTGDAGLSLLEMIPQQIFLLPEKHMQPEEESWVRQM